MQDSFFEFAEQVLGGGNDGFFFLIPGVFGYAMIPGCFPNSEFLFNRHIYSLWVQNGRVFIVLWGLHKLSLDFL
jgi:hypothetical protein